MLAQNELLRENQRIRVVVRAHASDGVSACGTGTGTVWRAGYLGGLAFPVTHVTLFALAGIGVFTAVLTYYRTPE